MSDIERRVTNLVRRTSPAPQTLLPDPAEYEQIRSIGKALAASGYFADIQSEAQAVVKILWGRDLGISPMVAIKSIHWITFTRKDGRKESTIEPSANLRAMLIKRSERYDYRIREHTDTRCRITFFEDGEEIGEVDYTIDMARASGLTEKAGSLWKQYGQDMVFAAALRRGQKRYCPDVIIGDTGFAAEDAIVVEQVAAAELGDTSSAVPTLEAGPSAERVRKRIFAICRDIGLDDEQRHAIQLDRFGKESLSTLTMSELHELADHLEQLKVSHAAGWPTSSSPADTPQEKDDGAPAQSDPTVLPDPPRQAEEPAPHVPATAELLKVLEQEIASREIDRVNVEGMSFRKFATRDLEGLDAEQLEELIKVVRRTPKAKQGQGTLTS